jgi:hypothetical protein
VSTWGPWVQLPDYWTGVSFVHQQHWGFILPGGSSGYVPTSDAYFLDNFSRALINDGAVGNVTGGGSGWPFQFLEQSYATESATHPIVSGVPQTDQTSYAPGGGDQGFGGVAKLSFSPFAPDIFPDTAIDAEAESDVSDYLGEATFAVDWEATASAGVSGAAFKLLAAGALSNIATPQLYDQSGAVIHSTGPTARHQVSVDVSAYVDTAAVALALKTAITVDSVTVPDPPQDEDRFVSLFLGSFDLQFKVRPPLVRFLYPGDFPTGGLVEVRRRFWST